MRPHPHEIKMRLEQKLHERQATVVGVHSVVMLDDNSVSVIFDIAPDASESGLHFEFDRPQLVGKDDIRDFAQWLASPDYADMTVH